MQPKRDVAIRFWQLWYLCWITEVNKEHYIELGISEWCPCSLLFYVPRIWYLFVHLCVVQSCGLDSLADTAWVTSPQRHPGQRAPGERGELGWTRAGSADVRGSDPVESLGTKCVVVPWEDLVDLRRRVCQSSDTFTQQRPGCDATIVGHSIHKTPTEVCKGSQIWLEII